MKKQNFTDLVYLQTKLFFLLGVLAGIIYAFGGLIIDASVSLNWLSSDETPGLSSGTILAFGALIGMPLIGAALGMALGLVQGVVLLIVTRILPKSAKHFHTLIE